MAANTVETAVVVVAALDPAVDAELSEAVLLAVEGASVPPTGANEAEPELTLQPTEPLLAYESVVLEGVIPQYSSSFWAEYCRPQRL